MISTSDSQCTKEVGNSGIPDGGGLWPIDKGYPLCEVHSSAVFLGAESKTGTGCEYSSGKMCQKTQAYQRQMMYIGTLATDPQLCYVHGQLQ